ncbi:SdrD B-like domain-containing protein, partial [Macrococcus capreoli]
MKKNLDFLPNKLNKYSIRKFTVGTTSIIIGSLLFLGHANVGQAETTEPPTTEAPTTTESPTTENPTTEAPTTTESPTTENPTTENSTTEVSTTEVPTTEPSTTETQTTENPTTEKSTTEVPTTEPSTTEVLTKEPSTTELSTTEAQTTEAPTTSASKPTTPTNTTSLKNIVSQVQSQTTIAAKQKTLNQYVQENTGVSADTAAKMVSNMQLNLATVSDSELLTALLRSIASQQDANSSIATPVGTRSLTSTMESLSIDANSNTVIKQLDANSLIENVVTTITDQGITDATGTTTGANDGIVNPLNGENMIMKTTFDVNDAAKAGDTFTVNFGTDIVPSDLDLHLFEPIPLEAFGQVVANGQYDITTNSITYTFTDFVDKYTNIHLNLVLNQYINRKVITNDTNQPTSNPAQANASITVGNNTTTQPFEVVYQNPIVQGPSNIESAYEYYDMKTGQLVQIIYVNQLLNNAPNTQIFVAGEKAYLTTNATGAQDLNMEVNKSAAMIDNSTQFFIYDAGDGSQLPDSMSDSAIPYNNFTQINPAINFGTDMATIDLGNISSAYVIKVVSKFDINQANQGIPIIQSAVMQTTDVNGDNQFAIYDNTIGREPNTSSGTGTPKRYEIGNRVWEDINRNGIQDAGEPGISDVPIYLNDEAGNKITVLTDANGNYLFTDLEDGKKYGVVFPILPPGYEYTTPNASGITSNNPNDPNEDKDSDGSTIVTINGASNLTVDAGVVNNNTYTLGNRIWLDTNKDGIQDATELNANQQIKVKLTNADGTPVVRLDGTTVADIITTDGNYEFTGLVDGNYKVVFEVPTGTMISPTNTTGDTLDSDGVQNVDVPTIIVADAKIDGENNDTVDLGILPATPKYSLGDKGFFDINGNGIQDADDLGFEGIQVDLLEADGVTPVVDQFGTPLTTYTDADGNYIFNGLDNGTYTVKFTLPEGVLASPANILADDAVDSDGVATSNPFVYTTTAVINNANNTTVDMGVYTVNTIGDKVWLDSNSDGIQDAVEPGIAGVTVNLIDKETNQIIDTKVTDSAGNYLFTGVKNGNYSVVFNTPGPVVNADGTITSYRPTTDNVGDSTLDSGADAQDVAIFLNDDLTIDKGFKTVVTPAPTYTIGDKVWLDTNNDNVQNGGTEPGISGVTVQLVDKATGQVISTQVTDANGNYKFDHLKPGDYTVVFGTPATVTNPDGSTTSYTEVTSTNETTNGDNSNVNRQDVSIVDADNLTIDKGFKTVVTPAPTYVIGDKVWLDTNNDNVQNGGTEPGISGVTVQLVDKATGQVISTQVTDANGNYKFDHLKQGDYTVVFGTPATVTNPDGSTTSYTEVTSTNETTNGDNSNVNRQDVSIIDADNLTIDKGFKTVVTPAP